MKQNKKKKTRTLAPCPNRPNCVSSKSTHPRHAIKPFSFYSDPEAALKGLLSILEAMSHLNVVTATRSYIHAECRSLVFRFVDDLEFLLDKKKNLIHVRSAARIGYTDFGVNRRRVEKIRKAFQSNRDGTPAAR